MSTESSDLLALDLPCDPGAPAAVRQALADVDEAGWPVGDAMLIASELVTNAVLHSGCSADHTVSVRASQRGNRILIAVHDPGLSRRPAEPRRHEGSAFGGWGLRIVEQLADRWGAERPDGYRVWAELAMVTDDSS
jgi:anti-sigma regulatory factor (Ser/Thr protein kinase)